MTRWETWLSHLSVGAVTASGVAYLWMKYFVENDDPFAVVNHPWQPAMLSLHNLVAPVVLFVLGLIVSSHVRKKLAGGSRANRRSGLIALVCFPLMAVSGYVLQISVREWIVQAALVLHLASSAVFVLGYLVHQTISVMLARALRHPVKVASIAALVLLASVVLLSASPVCVESTRQVFLMGTRATLVSCAADRETGLREMEAYLGILDDTEAELSTWREDSQISRLNRQPVGAAFLLNEPLSRMFETLYFWHEQTDGAFDPGIGALTEVWGIHEGGRLPNDGELRKAIQRSGLRHFGFDAGSRRIVRHRDATIDVGGFGKGEALDRVRAYAQAHEAAPFLIDLGGQILVHGLLPGRSDWEVSVADPQHRQSAAMSLGLTAGSLATSAGSERDVNAGGKRIGHIVDPRTGQTRVADYSVTVWHSSALAADILSTALYVMGPEAGITWADRNGVAALYQTPTSKTSRAWQARFD